MSLQQNCKPGLAKFFHSNYHYQEIDTFSELNLFMLVTAKIIYYYISHL